MSIKRMTEQELLEGLDAKGAHADELAEPLAQELAPLERLRGSVKRYVRPTDPVWDEYAGSDGGFIDDFMEDRDQPSSVQKKDA
jgi:antitoxin VapB